MDITAEKEKIFRQVRVQLGSDLRSVELTNETMCTLLEVAIGDYAELTQHWLVENQWGSLLGEKASKLDIAFALSTRSLDFETKFSYAYSKLAGLQAHGPWELKKDFVTIQAGQQVYTVREGREINEILYLTPPSTDMALMSYYGGFDFGFGGGFSQMGASMNNGAGGYGGGNGGYYIAPAFDILLTAQDFNMKNRLLRGDLTYKITAGPNGTRLLHLLSTPGSKLTFGNGMADGSGVALGGSAIGLQGCQVWYHYYDTSPENVDQCRLDNDDIIRMPNEVPLAEMDFSDLNSPTKILIRQVLTALSKQTLGRIRGKFGGIVGPPEAERTMDFDSLLSEGAEDYKVAMEKITDRLDRMSNHQMLSDLADNAENINRSLKHRALGWYVI